MDKLAPIRAERYCDDLLFFRRGLFRTFNGPWQSEACRPQDIDTSVPSEYLTNTAIMDKLAPFRAERYCDDLLFFRRGLFRTFNGPWQSEACRPQDIDTPVPSEYLTNTAIMDKLAPIRAERYCDDLLFFRRGLFRTFNGPWQSEACRPQEIDTPVPSEYLTNTAIMDKLAPIRAERYCDDLLFFRRGLFRTFNGPWQSEACRPQDIDTPVPSEYLTNTAIMDKLAPIRAERYCDDLLFFRRGLFRTFNGPWQSEACRPQDIDTPVPSEYLTNTAIMDKLAPIRAERYCDDLLFFRRGLFRTFNGPWQSEACRPQDIDTPVPSEYLTNTAIMDKLAPIRAERYCDDLLFFLFYMYYSDAMQLVAAVELYNRDWRYSKVDQVWITRAPSMPPVEKTNTYERGSYFIFDPTQWRKVLKQMRVDYDTLEDRPPTVPPLTSYSQLHQSVNMITNQQQQQQPPSASRVPATSSSSSSAFTNAATNSHSQLQQQQQQQSALGMLPTLLQQHQQQQQLLNGAGLSEQQQQQLHLGAGGGGGSRSYNAPLHSGALLGGHHQQQQQATSGTTSSSTPGSGVGGFGGLPVDSMSGGINVSNPVGLLQQQQATSVAASQSSTSNLIGAGGEHGGQSRGVVGLAGVSQAAAGGGGQTQSHGLSSILSS